MLAVVRADQAVDPALLGLLLQPASRSAAAVMAAATVTSARRRDLWPAEASRNIVNPSCAPCTVHGPWSALTWCWRARDAHHIIT